MMPHDAARQIAESAAKDVAGVAQFQRPIERGMGKVQLAQMWALVSIAESLHHIASRGASY